MFVISTNCNNVIPEINKKKKTYLKTFITIRTIDKEKKYRDQIKTKPKL